MSTMQTPPQEAQTEATIQRVDFDQRTGWYTIHTDQGEFSTKFPEPAQEAQNYVGQRVSLVYQLSEARQGRNGQWYQSRYLRRINAAYAQPQSTQAQQQLPQPFPGTSIAQPQIPPQPQAQIPQSPSTDEREMRIMRQTAGKLAVTTMTLVPSEERTFANQLIIAEAWLRYFIHGKSEDTPAPESGIPF